jgi:hypothetical protein
VTTAEQSQEPLSKRESAGTPLIVHFGADEVLIEYNRFWENGLAASIGAGSPRVGSVVFRRNLIFCGLTHSVEDDVTKESGHGIRISPVGAAEIYHNTFYDIRKNAIRLGTSGKIDRAVIINNIIAHAGHPTAARTGNCPPTPEPSGNFAAIGATLQNLPDPTRDPNLFRSHHNLFFKAPLPGNWPGPLDPDPNLRGKDPKFVPDPVNNDFYTEDREPKSPARDAALYIGGSFKGEGPDIGFLESPPDEPSR